MAVRGIRGATTVAEDRPEAIISATRSLLTALIEANAIEAADVAGAWFTATDDLHGEFPAVAARQLGWLDVPLLCGHEMRILAGNERAVPRCIRVLILLNTDRPASAMRFVYQEGASAIRADLDRYRQGAVQVGAGTGARP